MSEQLNILYEPAPFLTSISPMQMMALAKKGVKGFIDQLWDTIPWDKARSEAVPRFECFFNDLGTDYTYGSGRGERTYHPADDSLRPEFFKFVKWYVESHFGHKFEACFMNGYANDHQHLGWHADDSPLIDHSKPIVVFSFGAVRQIWIRENGCNDPEKVTKIALGNNSMFVMPPGMQQTHQHRIPKHNAECGKRISFTFRALLPV